MWIGDGERVTVCFGVVTSFWVRLEMEGLEDCLDGWGFGFGDGFGAGGRWVIEWLNGGDGDVHGISGTCIRRRWIVVERDVYLGVCSFLPSRYKIKLYHVGATQRHQDDIRVDTMLEIMTMTGC